MNRETKSILRFMGRTALTALPVLMLLILWYVIADPFKVLKDYEVYFEDPETVESRIGINKGLITFNNYERRLAEGKQYNAFIFGSSISIYYDANKWAELLTQSNKPNSKSSLNNQNISPYHFDSANESLMSMARKFRYLDKTGVDLEYALIVLDPIIMANDDCDLPPFIDPLQITTGTFDLIRYHYTFFRGAVNADFMKSYIPTLINGYPVNNGRNVIYEPQPIEYDPLTNQETLPEWDAQIHQDPNYFYKSHPLIESPEDITVSAPVLDRKRIESLNYIASILKKHKTDFKVVIGPNRSRITLNPEDDEKLNKIFGKENVFNFSSSMANELEVDTLLYDKTHYRPVFAEKIMKAVYLK